MGFSSVRFGDGPAYLFAARELLRTGHYPLATEPFSFRAPGYPVFLVAATLGNPGRIAVAKIANAVAGALAALLLAAISSRIFGRRPLAMATGAAAALDPGLLYLSTDIQSEPLFLLLLLCAGFLLLAAADRPSSNLAVLAGASAALAALTRPSALVLAPLLLAPSADTRHPRRVRRHLALSALLGFLLVLFPWALRNAAVFGELLPVNDAAGSAFYQGNSDWAVRFYEVRNRGDYRKWSGAMFADLKRQTAELERTGRGSPAERSRYFFRKALEERSGDPVGWLRLFARKAWDWVRPYASPLFWPSSTVWATGAFYAALTILGALGLAAAPRPGVRLFVLFFLGITMIAHVALIVVWRYRIPYWDPVLLLYGVSAGDTLLSRWKPSRS